VRRFELEDWRSDRAVVALLADVPVYAPAAERAPSVWPDGPPVVRRATHRPSPAVLRRRRAAAVVLAGTLLIGSWLGLQAALGRIGGGPLATTGAPGGPRPVAGRVWIVRPGDTLWSIAEAAHPGSDVRPLVDRLAAAIGSTELFPGETIVLPSG
jgi:hypothetical protein